VVNYKKLSIASLLLLSVILIFQYTNVSTSVSAFFSNKPIDIKLHGSHEVFDYNGLVERAQVIALVQVNDSLSKNNSTIQYIDNSPMIKYHYATRDVQVIEYYKNELGLGSTIEFNEPAAITLNNEYLHSEEYDALEKGKSYIVYLSNDNGLNELSIISHNNGVVYLDEFDHNEYKDVAVKSVLLANQIELPKDAAIEFSSSENIAFNSKQQEISEAKNKHLNISINKYFNEGTKMEYYNVGGIEFSINENQ